MNEQEFEDWLSSFGTEESPETHAQSTVIVVPQPQSLSDDDLNGILADNGIDSHIITLDVGVGEDVGVVNTVHQELIENEENPIVIENVSYSSEEPVAITAEHTAEAIQSETTVLSSVPEAEPIIPPNSPTLTLDTATSRFSGAEWYEEVKKARIIFAGCGGIGSNAIFQLARMSPASLVIYDDDTVETVNMSGQLFGRSNVGMYKVTAVQRMVEDYTTVENMYAINDRFTVSSDAGNIMMCGFDNMIAREIFFASWFNHVQGLSDEEKKKCLYLDGITKCLSSNL